MLMSTTATDYAPTLSDIVRGEIKALMGRNDITQLRLAALMHESQPTISKKLRGVQDLTLNDVGQFARALGVEPMDLLTPSIKPGYMPNTQAGEAPNLGSEGWRVRISPGAQLRVIEGGTSTGIASRPRLHLVTQSG